jgi:hypothetical protein
MFPLLHAAVLDALRARPARTRARRRTTRTRKA